MGYKTRGNYPVKICLKPCKNKGKLCTTCYRFSNFEEKSKENNEK